MEKTFDKSPKFWEECNRDGTTAKLLSLGMEDELLGICMDVQHLEELLTYLIAVKAPAGAETDGLVSRNIPASTWAVFPSIGPMPSAIQHVWNRIYQEWFPSTGYEHSGGPELEVYPPGDPTSADYRCEVWIPVLKN
jgi:AraC family transcriptional regulator